MELTDDIQNFCGGEWNQDVLLGALTIHQRLLKIYIETSIQRAKDR